MLREERFIGLLDVSSGRDAELMSNFVDLEMAGHNYNQKLVRQTYDGAVAMA